MHGSSSARANPLAAADGTIIDDRPWTVHWYSQADIRTLATEAGLTVTRVFRATGGPADEGDTDIVLLLRRDDTEAPQG